MEGIMENEIESPEQVHDEGRGSAFSRVMRFILRLIFVVVFGVVLGAALYLGIPALYRSTIEPMRANTEQIELLQESLAVGLSSSEKQVDQLGERLVEAEGRLAEQGETASALQAELDRVSEALDDQTSKIARLSVAADQVAAITTDLDATIDRVELLEVALSEVDYPVVEFRRQVQMVTAMTMITKARLWLIQDDLGQAAEEITAAKELLINSIADVNAVDDVMTQIIERLDLALADVRTTPIVAADELEIAWKLLVEATTPETTTPTPAPTLTPTPTPTP
jgi:predicted RNase H-like nuclease (RuvC/YqgF family)